MNFFYLISENAGKINNYLLIILISILSFSCVPFKKTKYLQGEKSNQGEVISGKVKDYKLQSHDVLQITIASMNPQVSDFFNLKQEGEKSSLKNYIVNDSGHITLPVLDSVFVKGLTIEEAQNLIKSRIRAHVTDATVVVKLAIFDITVLGEVNDPGVYSFDGDQVNVFQALGLAGDISDFGNRKSVKLMRKTGDSTKIILLDLTQRDIVGSDYFYLQPNDVLYVEPLKAKNFKQNLNQISLLVGIASLFLILYNVLK